MQFFGIVCLLLAQAQQPMAEPKRPVEILALIDMARAAPPEFSADILLRLAQSQLVPDRKWKRELISEAFTSGTRAQWPYKRGGGVYADERHTREAANNGLEALTLQTRSVEALLALDPQAALILYEQMLLPDLPNPTCTDVLYPDVAAYYETAAKIFDQAFTPKQRKDEEHLKFLEQRIRRMTSPAEVAPVWKMVAAVHVPVEQRQAFRNAFAASLDHVSGSDRVYGATEVELLGGPFQAMRNNESLTTVIPALRAYIVRHSSAARCSPNFAKPPEAVKQFNALIAALNAKGADFRQISADEAKPLKDDGIWKRDQFWQSPRSKQVLEALRWLNHGNRDLPGDKRFWTLEERSTDEWNAHYLDTLKLIEDWKEDEEPAPEDYFCMKALTYRQLAQLIPPGPQRNNFMAGFLAFVEQQYGLLQNRNLWFTEVQGMLSSAANSRDKKDGAWIMEQMARSRNPIIALYANVEKLLGGAR